MAVGLDTALQSLISAELFPLWQAFGMAQAIYYKSANHYRQVMPTPVTVPSDGSTGQVDWTLLPSYISKDDGFASLLGTGLPSALHCQVQVDIYNSPTGAGYVGTVTVLNSGTAYYLTVNVGPESERDSKGAWTTQGY